ncbi:MAG: DUF5662 family protein [Clostridia bacterium]
MNKFFGHLGKIIKHRHKVFVLCCKCGQFWRGLVHDMSKFSPTEFFEGVKYFTDGHGSPISNCRTIKGYSKAWIHHVHRNKHHLEYWYDKENTTQMNMPYKYAIESVCDKISATKCYRGKDYKPEDVLDHWNRTGSRADMNDSMRKFFTKVFTDLVALGEKVVVNKKYLKQTYSEMVK